MRSPQKYLISVVIPAYKQERTIREDIRRIYSVLKQLRHKFEIILIVDGKYDSTYINAKKLKLAHLKVLGYRENRGKGYAIRYGMSKSKGNIVGFIDSGMDINPNGLSMLLEHFEWYNADVIVGSKLHPVSKVHYPFERKILSWGYRALAKLLFGLKVRDTQAGIKFFKRDVVVKVLPRLLVKKYAFDIEILAVSNYLGYTRIFEAPIELDFKGVSSITSKSFLYVIGHMMWDTLAVFYRLRIIHYYDHSRHKLRKKVT